MQANRHVTVTVDLRLNTAQVAQGISGIGSQAGAVGTQVYQYKNAQADLRNQSRQSWASMANELKYSQSAAGTKWRVAQMQMQQKLDLEHERIAKLAGLRPDGKRTSVLDRIGGGLGQVQAMAAAAGVGGGVLGFKSAQQASPLLAEHLNNSFRLLVGEIGMSFLPALKTVATVFQTTASAVRSIPDPLKHKLGGLAVGLAGAAALAGGAGFAINGARTVIGAAKSIGGAFFSHAVGGAAGSAAGGAMDKMLFPGRAAGAGGVAGAATALVSNPVGWAALAALGMGVGGYFHESANIDRARRGEEKPWWAHGLDVVSWMSPAMLAGRGIAHLTDSGAAGTNPAMINRQAHFTTGEGFYEQMVLAAQGNEPPEIREQQMRGNSEFLGWMNSLNENTKAVNSLTANLTSQLPNPSAS